MVFGQSHFFKNMGGFLNIEGGFLNIGGFLDNLIFSRFFFQFLVPEAKQSLQRAPGAPWGAARCPFLVPPRDVQCAPYQPCQAKFKACIGTEAS